MGRSRPGSLYGYLHGITLAYKQLSPEYMANVSRASANNGFLQRDLDNQESATHRHLRNAADSGRASPACGFSWPFRTWQCCATTGAGAPASLMWLSRT